MRSILRRATLLAFIGSCLFSLSAFAQHYRGGQGGRNGGGSSTWGGQSWNNSPSYGYGEGRPSSDGSHGWSVWQNEVRPWLNLGLGALGGENNRPNRPPQGGGYRPAPNYNYPAPFYNQPPLNSRPAPMAKQPAKVRANKPPRKPAAVAKNKAPAARPVQRIDENSFALAGGAVQAQAKTVLDDFKTELGEAAMDPAVKAELEKLQDKLDNGEEITADDMNNVRIAANMSGLPFSADNNALQQTAGKLIGLSQANAALQAGNASGGGATIIPAGPMGIVMMPPLPAGQTLLLPDGNLMVGTGGEGETDYLQAEPAELFETPIGVGAPLADDDSSSAVAAPGEVLLLNPADNDAPIQYLLADSAQAAGGYNYSMAPGQKQRLSAGKAWAVRFDRGGGAGEARYTIKPGTYAFGPSDRGWDLFRQGYSVTIDNSGNREAFSYNVDDQPQQIAAGGTRTHKSDYPLVIRFDRGDGQIARKRVDDHGQRLRIAVDLVGGTWNLYPAANYDAQRQVAFSSGAGTAESDSSRVASSEKSKPSSKMLSKLKAIKANREAQRQ